MDERIEAVAQRVRLSARHRLPHANINPVRRGDASLTGLVDWTTAPLGMVASCEGMSDPHYPRVMVGPVDGEVLCEHCESFGPEYCPRHCRPPRSTASGLFQII